MDYYPSYGERFVLALWRWLGCHGFKRLSSFVGDQINRNTPPSPFGGFYNFKIGCAALKIKPGDRFVAKITWPKPIKFFMLPVTIHFEELE